MDTTEIESILENAYKNSTKVRLFYGNPVTGEDWNEEHDVIGYVGKSLSQAIFILLPLLTSRGGIAIDPKCIVRITHNKYEYYRHPNYKCAQFHIAYDGSRNILKWEVYKSDQVMARFDSEKKAQHYIAFMYGTRDKR